MKPWHSFYSSAINHSRVCTELLIPLISKQEEKNPSYTCVTEEHLQVQEEFCDVSSEIC